MTRGRRPLEAIRVATLIAEKRGNVQHYVHGPGMICTFTIVSPGREAQVSIKRVRHLRCSPQWLERETANAIAGLRLIVSSDDISRELWICSPTGTFRFFRVLDSSLIELGPDGNLIPAVQPSPRKKTLAVPAAQATALKDKAEPHVKAIPDVLRGSPVAEYTGSTSDTPHVPGFSVGEHILPDHEAG
jgi:hypothetical protein